MQKILDFIEKQKIQSDPGPTTQEWQDALAAYRAGDFNLAVTKLRAITLRQVVRPSVTKPYEIANTLPTQITSHYVSELLDLATRNAAK